MSDDIYSMTKSGFHNALRQAKEQAWDEGFQDGKRQDAEGDDGPRFTNPYRTSK